MSALATSVALAHADYQWRREAACQDTEPDLFFPVGTTGQAMLQIESAKKVCAGCSVQQECLEFAVATNQDAGVWGGTSEEERRKLRRLYVQRQRDVRAHAG